MYVIPALRYRDCPAAIEWLCQAFGFTKQAVYPNPDGTIAHAQLTLGQGMIMLGTATAPVQPSDMGVCLVVKDADGVLTTAKAAGATVTMDIADMDYGGRAFSCHDLEGYVWHVGTYNPWA
jgi:uncharacterized glyoxalase superfamily protein PhnB